MAPSLAKLPENRQQWKITAADFKLRGKVLHSYTKMKSASEATDEQYLLFRVLYNKPRDISMFDPTEFGLTQNDIQQAGRVLSASTEFAAYCQNLSTGNWRANSRRSRFTMRGRRRLSLLPNGPVLLTLYYIQEFPDQRILYMDGSIPMRSLLIDEFNEDKYTRDNHYDSPTMLVATAGVSTNPQDAFVYYGDKLIQHYKLNMELLKPPPYDRYHA